MIYADPLAASKVYKIENASLRLQTVVSNRTPGGWGGRREKGTHLSCPHIEQSQEEEAKESGRGRREGRGGVQGTTELLRCVFLVAEKVSNYFVVDLQAGALGKIQSATHSSVRSTPAG
eukprot:768637-Hanusia_phi.AAC.4